MTTVRRLVANDYSFGQGRANLATGIESVLQRCKTRLMQFSGEWFLDTNAGTAWAQVLGQRYSQPDIERLVRDRLKTTDGVLAVTALIVSFDRQARLAAIDATLATAGQTVYLENCAACHMDDGSGDISQGAPNLSDAIWLYGGSRDAVTYSVVNARFGVMPGWNDKLTEDEIRAVALYVHSRGGGQ